MKSFQKLNGAPSRIIRRFPVLVSAVPLLACMVVATAALLLETVQAEKVAPKLAVPDVLAVPNRVVTLEAWLGESVLLTSRGLGGEQLEFSVAGKKVGTAMTGADGRAFLEFTPRMRGNLPIAVKAVDSARILPAEAAGTLFSWERRRPIMLVEVAALIEETRPIGPVPTPPGLTLSPSPAEALPDAPEELKRLTDFYYNAIYISRGDAVGSAGLERLRHWLQQHRFPPGFSVVIGARDSALGEKIDEWRSQGWDQLKAGIGRTPGFAEVLVGHRMDVIIVPEPERGGLPRKAQSAKSWKEVRKKNI
jgi:hypothetical protein